MLDLGDRIVNYLAGRGVRPFTDLKGGEEFEQVGAYLLTSYMRLGSISHASLAKRHDADFVAKLDTVLHSLAEQLDINADLAARHPGVSPVGLQHLLEIFRSYEREPENLLPAEVASDDAYDRFVTIMRRINKSIYPAFEPEGRVGLYALIVVQWLKGKSLAEIIRRNIAWHQDAKRPYKLPSLIRDTMSLVEEIARFKAPKYLSAYMDVLHLHLRSIGREDLIDQGLDISTQLEFGVSSRTLISLMELGLSRMSAVALYEKIARDDLGREECREWVVERADQLNGMDIPAVIVRELRARLLSNDGSKPAEEVE